MNPCCKTAQSTGDHSSPCYTKVTDIIEWTYNLDTNLSVNCLSHQIWPLSQHTVYRIRPQPLPQNVNTHTDVSAFTRFYYKQFENARNCCNYVTVLTLFLRCSVDVATSISKWCGQLPPLFHIQHTCHIELELPLYYYVIFMKIGTEGIYTYP